MTTELTKEQLLVIGAGPVGLALARALKEKSIPYYQVEADDDVGGNWYHGVYETAHIISSRKTTEYSDYPMPPDYPDFPSRQQMLEYYRDYTKHFGLRENIRFHTRVVHVRPCEDNLWEVSFADRTVLLFKGVAVCNGHHWDRRWPEYPGEFDGEWIHSKDYKDPEQLRGKRVLVIGGGNSACDIASEAARVGAKADLSLRNGVWFLPKTMLGTPAPELMIPGMPMFVQRSLIALYLRLTIGKYEDYGLPTPTDKLFSKHPTVSTEVLHYLQHGRLHPMPDVRSLHGSTVEFVDGRREEYDMVVCATGYHVSFPFLPEGLVTVEGPVAKVYAGAFVPHYKHLYILGTTQPRYGIGPLLTPGTKFFADMIALQEELEHPIGTLLQKLGAKLPETHLQDPMKVLAGIRLAKRLLPRALPKQDRKLKKTQPIHQNPIKAVPASINYDMEVY